MYTQETFDILQEAMGVFAPFYQQEMRKAIEEQGLPNQWFILNLARGLKPEPLTIDRLHELFPYTKSNQLANQLKDLKRQKWLKVVREGEYRISNKGRSAIEKVYNVAQEAIGAVEGLPADELKMLSGLLERLIESTLSAEEPAKKQALQISRWTDPGRNAPLAVKVDQYLTDLVRFRDDAHIAAWKPYDISPQAWEALTFIWRGEAQTAEELVEKLSSRGWTTKEYQQALLELAEYGWVEQTLDGFRITEQGKRIRQEAEAETDRLFFGPWNCLREIEASELLDLLSRTSEHLKYLPAVPEG
jgi:DNA-binding MarR family transcriptional regulator